MPTTVGLLDLCQHYITHRLEVIVRRTHHRRARAQDRLHIVEGLVIALDAIDEVVAIIRSSQDAATARARLIERFSLSDVQATHILDMPLRRLTALAKLELEEERADLLSRIADFVALLDSETRQRRLVQTELAELVEKFGRPRRSEIVAADDIAELAAPLTTTSTAPIANEACVLTLSSSGQLGRTALDGAKRSAPGRHDVLLASVVTSTGSEISAITSEARILRAMAGEVADANGRTRGSVAAQVFGTTKGEEVLAIVADGLEPIVLVTATGVVKRVSQQEVAETKPGRTIMTLREGDQLVAAFGAPDGADVVLVTVDAQALRTPTSGISIQGRGAGGVAGIALRPDSRVVGAGPVVGDTVVVAAGGRSTVKVTPADEIPSKGRGGQGVRITRFADGEQVTVTYVGSPVGLMAVMSTDEDHTKPDPTPVPFDRPPTKRDLVPAGTERQVLDLGPGRW